MKDQPGDRYYPDAVDYTIDAQQRLIDELSERVARMAIFVNDHVDHAAWCNGGYPDGTCYCGRDERVRRITG